MTGIRLHMGIDMLFASILLSLALGIPAYYVMRLRHHGQIAWQNTALQMGFLPVAPDKTLETTIDRFNHRVGYHIKYQMQGVYRKSLPDAEIYLFDWVPDPAYRAISQQPVVAARSLYLTLPSFCLFSKTRASFDNENVSGAVFNLNASRFGRTVEFPVFPAFALRYTVLSHEARRVQEFFNMEIADYFINCPADVLFADQDTFLLFQVQSHFDPGDAFNLNYRLASAINLLALFRS